MLRLELNVRIRKGDAHLGAAGVGIEYVANEQHLSFRWVSEQIPGARYVEIAGVEHFFGIGDTGLFDELDQFEASIGRDEARFDRVLSTVLFTDICGSTARAAVIGDREWRGLWNVITLSFGRCLAAIAASKWIRQAMGSSQPSIKRRSKRLPAKRPAAWCWDICNAVADLTLSIACWPPTTARAPCGPWWMASVGRWLRFRPAMSSPFPSAWPLRILRRFRRTASWCAQPAIRGFPLALQTKRSIIGQVHSLKLGFSGPDFWRECPGKDRSQPGVPL